MRITISARHCEIPDELRIRARALVERLARLAPRSHDGQVVFEADHGSPTVEVRLYAVRGAVHVGTAGGADHRTALDRAVAKVRRQLDKSPARRRKARGGRRGVGRRAQERELR
jgi:ribosomal subunit interface protein